MQSMETGKTASAFAGLGRDKPDKLIPNPKARLREQVREVMRFHHYSLRTEEAYWQWIKRFIFFHGKRVGTLRMGECWAKGLFYGAR
jgi:hypothetical protein